MARRASSWSASIFRTSEGVRVVEVDDGQQLLQVRGDRVKAGRLHFVLELERSCLHGFVVVRAPRGLSSRRLEPGEKRNQLNW